MSLAFVLTVSHPQSCFTLFCFPHRAAIAKAMGIGWYEGSADWVPVCSKGWGTWSHRQTGVSLSICTCCPEMTMLRVSSQREQETVLKIAFPFPHHTNSCWSLQNMFSRQWTAFYSAIKTREAGTETGLTFEPRSLKIISTSRILPNCCRETREKKKKKIYFWQSIFPTFCRSWLSARR